MGQAQAHRGPDGHGYAVWGHNASPKRPVVWRGPNTASPDMEVKCVRLGLAHNWLAIQDTNSAAGQPMTLQGQRCWVVFNGEIYNFVELREELVSEGVTFETSSDTEVLLVMWQRHGPKALAKLRGMFAFIIYDSQEDVLWAVRDRFGIKPLYYVVLPDNRGVILASEFRGIHASGLVPRRWNQLAVQAFLAAGVNKPGDSATFFDDVSELPPGCLLRIGAHSVTLERYYELPRTDSPTLGPECLPDLRDQFIDVINLHLRSAREVGTCMSGGLDSTNIASAIHHVLGPRVSNFRAFTFGSPGHLDYDLAQIASHDLRFRHYTMAAPDVISLDDLVDMIVACETPNHVWGPINQYLLLRYIHSDHRLHVLLDGQGGDEVFSGYAWFYPAIEQHVLNNYGAEEAAVLNASHFGRPPFPLPILESFHRIFFSRRKWLEASDGGSLASLGLSAEEVLGWDPVNYFLNDKLDWPSFRSHEFYRRELPYLLRQEDRLAMWFSIESRVPFLDHTFVELVSMIGPRFLVHDGYLKYPLRVLFPELPHRVRFNVPKRGFWEDYAILPKFEEIGRFAVKQSPGLSKLIRHQEMVDKLSTQALWRFFQMSVLLEGGTRDEAKAWVHSLRKHLPRCTLTHHPWVERVRRRAESVLQRLA